MPTIAVLPAIGTTTSAFVRERAALSVTLKQIDAPLICGAVTRKTKMTGISKMALRRLTFCSAVCTLALAIATAPARAQDATAATPAQTQSRTPSDQNLSEGQIEQLVAPIALYPDPLLTQILMASTYPLEVGEAARWSQDNTGIRGHALEDAMQTQSWDPSVKALTAVPQTLEMMSDKLDWTQQLGDAFLAQQQDVLSAVQKLRAEAQAAGNLQSTPQQVVTTAPAEAAASDARRPIVIEPINPDVYYVPVYNPAVVYGAWDYPAYQPFYWSPPGFVASNIVSFTAGVVVGAAIWGGCDWWDHSVIINVNRYNVFNHTNINVTNNTWIHNPVHRGNVPYRNAAVAERFGRGNDAAARDGLRGRADAQHDDMFKDRADFLRPDAVGDHVDAQRPDASPRIEGDIGNAASRIAPALPDGRDGELKRNDGDQRVDRAMLERRDLTPPRAQAFPPARRAIGSGFHGRGGGRHRA
jgi:hypothetical protein